MRLFAEPSPAVAFDLIDDVDLGGLPHRLRALFLDANYRPPSPPVVALELIALSRKGDLDINEATELFQRDPLLMARVLKCARAPLYGAAKVPTIRDAILRLGERRLKGIVMEAALDLRLFRSERYKSWMESVRRHSVAVGHIAAHIAAHISGGVDVDTGQAYVAGLMHDIGFAAALGAVDQAKDLVVVDPKALGRALERIHTDVGAVVVDAWELNVEVEAVVSGHHHVQKSHDPVLATVVLAEAFAIDGGFAGQADVGYDEDLAWARRDLGITDEGMTRIGRELAPLFAVL